MTIRRGERYRSRSRSSEKGVHHFSEDTSPIECGKTWKLSRITRGAGNTHDEDSMEVDAISRKGKGKEKSGKGKNCGKKGKEIHSGKGYGETTTEHSRFEGECRNCGKSSAARMAHNATHVPFNWCPICVASRGRNSPHRRVVVHKTADTLPEFQTDYMFIRTVAESKTQPCITFVETRSGVVISFMCARKGGYEDLTKEILRPFEAYGFLNPVIIRCDKEMSIIVLCRKVARERNARTVLRFAQKQVIRATGLSKQCTDTTGTRTLTTRHKLRRTLAYNFQPFHLPFHLQFVALDLFPQDSQCDPRAKPINICFELHMYHVCACLVNRYLL